MKQPVGNALMARTITMSYPAFKHFNK